MKRPAGASYTRFRELVRRRAEGLRSLEAPRIALVWAAAPGTTCRASERKAAGYVGHRVPIRSRASSTRRKLFSKIVLASPSEFPYSTSSHGGVAQLGERLTGSQEVRGSIPLVSTIVNARPLNRVAFFICTRYLATLIAFCIICKSLSYSRSAYAGGLAPHQFAVSCSCRKICDNYTPKSCAITFPVLYKVC